MYPNRVVAVATAVLSLVVGLVPVIGNFDWQSTAGVLAGIAAACAVAIKWLHGWQIHEGHVAWSETDGAGDDLHPALFNTPTPDPANVPADEGDPGQPAAKAARKPTRKAVKR